MKAQTNYCVAEEMTALVGVGARITTSDVWDRAALPANYASVPVSKRTCQHSGISTGTKRHTDPVWIERVNASASVGALTPMDGDGTAQCLLHRGAGALVGPGERA